MLVAVVKTDCIFDYFVLKWITFFQLQEDFHLTSSESRRSRPAFQQMRHMLQRSYRVLPSSKSLEDYRLCSKTFQKEFDRYLKVGHFILMSIYVGLISIGV